MTEKGSKSTDCSEVFSHEVKTFFSEAKSGHKLIFENIKVEGPDGTIWVIPSLVVKVK